MSHSIEREVEFAQELQELLAKYGLGDESGTPDHYLAAYVVTSIRNYNATVGHRVSAQGELLDLPSISELTRIRTRGPKFNPHDLTDEPFMGGWTPDPSTRF